MHTAIMYLLVLHVVFDHPIVFIVSVKYEINPPHRRVRSTDPLPDVRICYGMAKIILIDLQDTVLEDSSAQRENLKVFSK